ncbi:MAG TPA: hypothetical protein VGK25_07095, partial [Ignavibacteria bacterium]
MIKSKAIEIIQTFDSREFHEFGKFVDSPFFNSNTKLIEMYSLLKKFYPAFSQKNFTKENLYQKLFPGKKYNDGTMRKLLSSLQSLAEEYLANTRFMRNQTFQKRLALMQRLDEKKLDVLFKQQLYNIQKLYENEGYEDVYFRNNFELYETLLSYMATKAKFDVDIQIKCFFYLISHCIILSLKISQNLITGNIEHSFDYKNTLLFKFTKQFDIEGFIEEIKNYSPDFYP